MTEQVLRTYPISDTEGVDVVTDGTYFYVVLRVNGKAIGNPRSGFGKFLVAAEKAASTWARGIAYDRTVVR